MTRPMKYTTTLALLAALCAGRQASAAEIKGKFLFDGEAPAATAVTDPKAASEFPGQTINYENLVVDPATKGIANLNNISQIFEAHGDYDTALHFLKQSLAITQEIGDKKGEGTILNNISQIFKAHGDYDTALHFLKQSLAITQEVGNKAGEGTTLNNISQIY